MLTSSRKRSVKVPPLATRTLGGVVVVVRREKRRDVGVYKNIAPLISSSTQRLYTTATAFGFWFRVSD